MARRTNVTVGERFGRWTVMERFGVSRYGQLMWRVRCQCGGEKVLTSMVLTEGKSKSCGCFRRERKLVHGHNSRTGKTKLFRVWDNMIQRCTNPANTSFKNYGGRGITVAPRWRMFALFAEDMAASWTPGVTIERIDNDGNYSPDNCRWVSRGENLRNKRTNIFVEHAGEQLCLLDWARRLNMCARTLYQRYAVGDRGEALFRASLKRSKSVTKSKLTEPDPEQPEPDPEQPEPEPEQPEPEQPEPEPDYTDGTWYVPPGSSDYAKKLVEES